MKDGSEIRAETSATKGFRREISGNLITNVHKTEYIQEDLIFTFNYKNVVIDPEQIESIVFYDLVIIMDDFKQEIIPAEPDNPKPKEPDTIEDELSEKADTIKESEQEEPGQDELDEPNE